jgi:hypothetical protein
MKKTVVLCALTVALFSSCEEGSGFSEAFPDLTNEEVIEGLKSALEVGTDNSSQNLHKRDGYYRDEAVKIFLPDEAAVILDHLDRIPGGDHLVDNTIESINRAAEDAAIEAKPIFINAITSMTISDGFAILDGADDAATTYLKDKTYDSLQMAFQPKIQVSLEKPLILNKSSESLYSSLITSYNAIPRIPFIFEEPEITENTLSEYTTRRALDGLFLKVADEETQIRNDPAKRVNDILVKVFGRDR